MDKNKISQKNGLYFYLESTDVKKQKNSIEYIF